MYSLLADATVVLHLAFVLFVVSGGLAVLRWPRMAWVHLPAAAWGVLIEFAGWICPLTPLENWLRRRAGEAAYESGFIEHYVTAVLYPAGLSRTTQWILGALALAVNVAIYTIVLRRRRAATAAPTGR
jgi:hypothetical protein